jgi:hypothetical protein
MPGMAISVRSVVSQQAGPDTHLEEALQQAQEAGEPLQLRFAPLFYKRSTRGYSSWREMSWTVGVHSAEEAVDVRRAVEAFFDAVATGQVAALTGTLQSFKLDVEAKA